MVMDTPACLILLLCVNGDSIQLLITHFTHSLHYTLCLKNNVMTNF